MTSIHTCPDGCKQEQQNGIMYKIEALLAIAAALSVFLGIFGSFRRCCGSRAFSFVAFGAYTLLPAVIAYTLGLIQNAPFSTFHFPIWAAYLVLVFGSADSYTAHSIENVEQWKSFNVNAAAKCFMASWMIASCVTPFVPVVWTVFLFVILFVKIDGRARALMLASNFMTLKNQIDTADYMSGKHLDNRENGEDPATMRGYRYLVRVAGDARAPFSCSKGICGQKASCSKGIPRQRASPWLDEWGELYCEQFSEIRTDRVITIEKVWSCEGRLLSVSEGDPDGRLKDLCLSFSLFKFICLRFAGYSLPKEAHDKLRHLIQYMLSQDNGYERIFRVIEVELAFLFDLFYTKYPVNLNPCRSVYRFLQLAIVVAATLFSLSLAPWYWPRRNDYDDLRFPGYVVTILFLMSILVIEFVQFGFMIFSEWAKVTYICKYVQNEWLQRNRCAGKLIEVMCRVWLLKPWGRQLRQYSLLEAYSYSPWKWMYNRLTVAYLGLRRDGRKQIAPTNLSQQVKKAIARSLWENYPRYKEKGNACLRLNPRFNELSWAYRLETTIHIIMVWHVATTFCEHEAPLRGPQPSQEQKDNFGIATQLSQYLAYLVAFTPRLLPGHPCKTERIFGHAVHNARDIFRGSSGSMGERIEKLKDIDKEKGEETILSHGARLGMQLVSQVEVDEGRIWKVLADFWVEMMLYVAPSDDTAAHANYLTTGGEFVTHVWVLLSHLGITREL